MADTTQRFTWKT